MTNIIPFLRWLIIAALIYGAYISTNIYITLFMGYCAIGMEYLLWAAEKQATISAVQAELLYKVTLMACDAEERLDNADNKGRAYNE